MLKLFYRGALGVSRRTDHIKWAESYTVICVHHEMGDASGPIINDPMDREPVMH